MKAIKIFTATVFAITALSFAACSSKKATADENAYVPPATETTPVADQPTTPEQPAYLGASSSGLGL